MNSNSVTAAGINARIKSIDFLIRPFLTSNPNDTTTICRITMVNGFTIDGFSACADPYNFNEDIGKKYAHEQAFDKLWMLEGYLLKERLHQQEVASAE